ncbi:MAG: tripartite tricarboxylate transporter substrate binding protein [Rhizobiales bacterium]|nr:tripartite tricarboxylate transporter substrate binding protein [Hyphomicrobiales bacterium]
MRDIWCGRRANRGREISSVRIIAAALTAFGLVLAPCGVRAEVYPSRPVKMVVGFAPGGVIDVVARIVGERLASKLGKPFVVENRSGANGMLAADAVATAPPDGYTIFMSNSTTITLNPTLFKNISYNPERDFAAVTTVISGPLVLVINPEHPLMANVKSLPDLIALAKSKPGELPYGSAGNGNITQIAMELLSNRAGVQMLHIPYRGAAAAQVATLGKEVVATFDTLGVVPLVQSGKLRALAVSSPERTPALPDVPTVAEQGYPGFDVAFWSGVFVPKATPASVVEILHREIVNAANDPAVQARLASHGTVLTLSPAGFSAKIKKETAELADIVAKAGIKSE